MGCCAFALVVSDICLTNKIVHMGVRMCSPLHGCLPKCNEDKTEWKQFCSFHPEETKIKQQSYVLCRTKYTTKVDMIARLYISPLHIHILTFCRKKNYITVRLEWQRSGWGKITPLCVAVWPIKCNTSSTCICIYIHSYERPSVGALVTERRAHFCATGGKLSSVRAQNDKAAIYGPIAVVSSLERRKT